MASACEHSEFTCQRVSIGFETDPGGDGVEGTVRRVPGGARLGFRVSTSPMLPKP